MLRTQFAKSGVNGRLHVVGRSMMTVQGTDLKPGWLNDVTTQTLSEKLGMEVHSWSIRKPRELEQSDCCELHVQLIDQQETQRMLLKRYNLRRLMNRIQKPEAKWRISAYSFINEYNFLHAPAVMSALHTFLEPVGGVPTIFHASGKVSEDDWFDRKVGMV